MFNSSPSGSLTLTSKGISIHAPSCRSGLIPEGHARVIVLAFIPARALVVRVLIGRDPAEVLESHLDARAENDRIGEMPAIGACVPADDAPLVEVGNTKVGRPRFLEAPRG